MRVLVTRPEDDARDTAARLTSLGHRPILAPLIAVLFLDGPEVDLGDVSAILATSANGIRALARRTPQRGLSVFAVGRQTASAANALGFTDVRSADGDVDALAALVAKAVAPGQGALLHAASREASGALAASLRGRGYDVRHEVLYQTPSATVLPVAAEEALQTGTIDAVLHFSPRSAAALCRLILAGDLQPACARIISACISRAAAEPLKGLKFREVRIATAPNQDSLLACLG